MSPHIAMVFYYTYYSTHFIVVLAVKDALHYLFIIIIIEVLLIPIYEGKLISHLEFIIDALVYLHSNPLFQNIFIKIIFYFFTEILLL